MPPWRRVMVGSFSRVMNFVNVGVKGGTYTDAGSWVRGISHGLFARVRPEKKKKCVLVGLWRTDAIVSEAR